MNHCFHSIIEEEFYHGCSHMVYKSEQCHLTTKEKEQYFVIVLYIIQLKELTTEERKILRILLRSCFEFWQNLRQFVATCFSPDCQLSERIPGFKSGGKLLRILIKSCFEILSESWNSVLHAFFRTLSVPQKKRANSCRILIGSVNDLAKEHQSLLLGESLVGFIFFSVLW